MSFLINGNTRRVIQNTLNPETYELLSTALNSFCRLLPHVEIEIWRKTTDPVSFASWATHQGQQRRAINLQIYLPQTGYSLSAKLKRKIPGIGVAQVIRVLDNTEMSICKSIVTVIVDALVEVNDSNSPSVADYYRREFDEIVVLNHLKKVNELSLDLADLINFLKTLSEQSYENKSLSFGVLISKKGTAGKSEGDQFFPKDFIKEKKYRAFTDGYRSAYLLDKYGRIKKLVDLEATSNKSIRGEHFSPQWSQNLALSSIKETIGFALTRQGDILYFENGSLRFTKRFGKWQYWNHSHIIEILKSKARAQHIQPEVLGKVVSKLYKCALDISFRHSGALFVILRNQGQLHELVRWGDGLRDDKSLANISFEQFLIDRKILGIDNNVLIELASIDGAVLFSNNGYLLAYGAVLTPKRRKGTHVEEGSRSKAAIGASNYGLAIKISSDGGISIFQGGKKFIEV